MLRRLSGGGFCRIYDSKAFTSEEAAMEFIDETGIEHKREEVYSFDVLTEINLCRWVMTGYSD